MIYFQDRFAGNIKMAKVRIVSNDRRHKEFQSGADAFITQPLTRLGSPADLALYPYEEQITGG